MLNKIIMATVLASSLFFVGCTGGSSGPSPEQISKMDFGPKPKNIKVANLKGGFHTFKDPESVRVKFTGLPLRRGYTVGPLDGKIYWTGWVAVVKANAKNSYGAYTGEHFYYVTLFNGHGTGAYRAGDDRILKVID